MVNGVDDRYGAHSAAYRHASKSSSSNIYNLFNPLFAFVPVPEPATTFFTGALEADGLATVALIACACGWSGRLVLDFEEEAEVDGVRVSMNSLGGVCGIRYEF